METEEAALLTFALSHPVCQEERISEQAVPILTLLHRVGVETSKSLCGGQTTMQSTVWVHIFSPVDNSW